MSIAPEEFLAYINGAFDGMVQIVETLGDERVNLRPNNMSNTNSPFAILTHCVGLTRYWIGTVLAGRQVQRDRDAEFRAQGTVAEIRQAVRELQQHIQEDLKHVRGDQPSAFPEAVRQPQMQTWTQGHFLLQCYKELAQHHGHMELTRDVLLGHGPGN
jgi:cysteine-S-conjugate beta-lyase